MVDKEASLIFSLSDLKWRNGPSLPAVIGSLGFAQVNNGFIVVGGAELLDKKASYNSVFRFDQSTYEWSVEEPLLVGRNYAAVVAVPNDFLLCYP